MRRLAALAAGLATFVCVPAAFAQGATVQALDDTLQWSPAEVTVKAGETVTWSWDGDPPHNVASTTGSWPAGTTSPFPHTFPTAGTYNYVCEFHFGMNGKVIVTDESGTPPPPPPPPPPSEQPWANDQQPPTVFELADEVRPELDRVRVAAVRNGARVRFRLSERAEVIVRFKFGGVVVKTARRTFGKGPGTFTIHDRRMHGRYMVEVLARDLTANRSRVERERLTIR